VYKSLPSFVLGFHGCDRAVAEKIISTQNEYLKQSENNYDWLGHGIYFWENDPQRALQYAIHLKTFPRRSGADITNPAVIGAIINLGRCLNLIEADSLQILKDSYERLCLLHKESGLPLPENKNPFSEEKDLLLRRLDCAVVEMTHAYCKEKGWEPFDTVRGVFWEGNELYKNAGFREKNHIQICVRNHDCIKGFFHPRKKA
jgi:hypothetical protein